MDDYLVTGNCGRPETGRTPAGRDAVRGLTIAKGTEPGGSAGNTMWWMTSASNLARG
jgi:hypothetical protein